MDYHFIPKLGYITSQSDLSRKYFNVGRTYFNEIGFKDIVYFELDVEYTPSLTNELLNREAIFLSGGNTFIFLENIRKRGFIPLLQKYVENGGILIGQSAGSILMSKTIEMATFLDENVSRLNNINSLHLVDFEFMPHWEGDSRLISQLENLKSHHPIYACKDGDWISVNGEEVQLHGEIIKIEKGY
ncbi:Type 1 glutamine amidotransferase-like domain-containing protein [Bacillus salitolerans]|uniref:Type 1 glutamine amidotransferase-like domain-containing protein n=1 Tax=Bacillus salitolerans TaxID=1437434 RepID=A0ABW4LMP8_9BACI